MKIVREHINEKFTEDSDPISDMGIGIDKKRTFKTTSELTNWVYKHLAHILGTDKIPDDIIQDPTHYLKKQYIFIAKTNKTFLMFMNIYYVVILREITI